jgi:hypothetical protein
VALALVLQNRAALLKLNNMPDIIMLLRQLPPATLAPDALLPAMFRLRKCKVRWGPGDWRVSCF